MRNTNLVSIRYTDERYAKTLKVVNIFFLHRQFPCQEDAKSFQKRQGCSMISGNNLWYFTSCSTKHTWKFPADFTLTDSLINCLFITVTLYASKYEIKGTVGMGLNNLKLTKKKHAHAWMSICKIISLFLCSSFI